MPRKNARYNYSAYHILYSLSNLEPETDKIAWLKSRRISIKSLNETLTLAAEQGVLEIVELLTKLPGVDPSANNNSAIRMAAQFGHLAIVKFLITLPGVTVSALNNYAIGLASGMGHFEIVKLLSEHKDVDVTDDNHFAIRWAVTMNHHKVANYLASLPCYNPFAPDIADKRKQELIDLLTKLKLGNHVISHWANKNSNLFLFFKGPVGNGINNDVKRLLIEKSQEIDKFQLAR